MLYAWLGRICTRVLERITTHASVIGEVVSFSTAMAKAAKSVLPTVFGVGKCKGFEIITQKRWSQTRTGYNTCLNEERIWIKDFILYITFKTKRLFFLENNTKLQRTSTWRRNYFKRKFWFFFFLYDNCYRVTLEFNAKIIKICFIASWKQKKIKHTQHTKTLLTNFPQ